MPMARQRVSKHVPTTTNTSVAMKHAVNTTIEEDVFSMGSPRDCMCISSAVVNQKSVVEGEQEWSMSSAVKEEGFC
jgi:hypothetical protein